ncbi:branched-chain amino acid ABC transporter permease [Allosediminivita pacifica]|uniref:Amino acid/amide ABC transporter membrane protein 2 (HAAT family) n=1 Tax=Allosediminivita pacifica TaxID=1267769 RepID=A0A2T6A4D5_9RHOB|nr:branched-chain amino acid ABC transporter permease [Allosediminivita pacifica]PTX38667.1 amino acid/amide ABC transporter membrane protein 2 (HAAT family) [Allosediminivita pacifica]GGB28943.1 branched-chain amino acid ABC transporter permease [Allosediminivita pacifica]
MKRSLLILAVIAIAAILLGLALDPRSYGVRVLCLILMAAALGQAWNIVGGLANQISLGHAAFFGIGAYTSTVLQVQFELTPWIGMPIGAVLAAVAAGAIALPTMRLKGPYFALATLAFGEICRIGAQAMSGVTGGPQGLSVPFYGDSLAMMQFRQPGAYVPLFAALFFLVSAVFAVMSHGRLGYMLRAVRENEEAAEVTGIDTVRIKLTGAIISAACTALVGGLFAQFTFFIDPDTVFSTTEISIRAALIAIVGGVGLLWGPIVGALFVVLVEEFLNSTLSDALPGISPFLFGVALVVIVIARPEGLVSFRHLVTDRFGKKGKEA